MVTGDASGLRGGSGGLDAAGRPRPRALRDPGGVRPSRRHPGDLGVALAPQAPRHDADRLHVVGSPRLGWWIGVLFAIGSICFALGSFPPYATGVGTNPDDLTFFIGSIFFTTASFMVYYETAPRLRRSAWRHAPVCGRSSGCSTIGSTGGRPSSSSRARCGSTGPPSAALVVGLGASSSHHPVWRPDALGSVCFLVSSWLSWAEECHGPFAWRPSSLSWWITTLNLTGSVAFGVSAIASYVKPNGQFVSLALTNLGTFVGALCFLAGGVLLLPERTLASPSAEPAGDASPSARSN